MVSMLILAVLSVWIPYASAEMSEELDPMVSPDAQATVTNETTVSGATPGQTSNGVTAPETTTADKKAGETKKEKSKKKSSEKKKKKSSTKSSKKHKKSSN